MNCPRCNREVTVKSSVKMTDGKALITYTCGHIFVGEPNEFRFFKGKKNGFALYPYQVKSCDFVKKAKGRVLLTLEMGLGKTPISLISALALGNYPVLILTKSSLKIQTLRESINWIGEFCQILESPKDKLLPLKFFIMSIDMVRKFKEEDIERLPFKTIIIDECQSIKNLDSQRTIGVIDICKGRENVIALSATPIKNRFDEFFPILHILQPELFPSYNNFVKTWCDYYTTSRGVTKIGACKDPEGFKELTKDFIIRFNREDVLPDLPKIRRDFRYYDMDKDLKKAYDSVSAEYTELYEKIEAEGASAGSQTTLMGFLAKMRHLTGLSKIENTIEFVEDFLLSYDKEKIVIFTDHKDVASMIEGMINKTLKAGGYSPAAHLHSGLDPIARADMVEYFRNDTRVMIASTKAAGEGLNLQFCSHCVFVERQWNPANEEQAEGRFPRPGNESSHIECTYMIALGTIDEWITEIIEEKRAIVKAALNNVKADYKESDILEQLSQKIAASGKKKWSYK